jgi:hypothetical protein
MNRWHKPLGGWKSFSWFGLASMLRQSCDQPGIWILHPPNHLNAIQESAAFKLKGTFPFILSFTGGA